MASAGDLLMEIVMEPLRDLIASGIIGESLAATPIPLGDGVRLVDTMPKETTKATQR